MPQTIAIDTNIAVFALNGKPGIIEELSVYSSIYLPVIVCGELLFGARNSTRVDENLRKFTGFIHQCTILSVNELVANEYAEIRKQLKNNGTPIPENDIWIAAICLVHDIALMTNDAHFAYIKKLRLVRI